MSMQRLGSVCHYRHCAPGWPAAARSECRMAFRRQYRGLEDTEIFSRETGLEMFDIVNREYEENGSFRCDFFRNERT